MPSRKSGNASSMAAMNISPATPPTASRWMCMPEGPFKPQRLGRCVLPVFAQHRVEIALGVELERLGAADNFKQRGVCLDDRQHGLGNMDVHDLERGGNAHDPGVLRLDPYHRLDGKADRF